MSLLRAFRSLGAVDARNIFRDPLLRWIILAPLMIGLAARTLLPVLFLRLSNMLRFDLAPYYSAVVSYLLLITPPLLVGFVTGFLLLDEKDDRTLTALQVTPISLNRYLAYRLTAPMILSMVTTLAVFPLSGTGGLTAPRLLLAALAAAPQAPLFALLLAGFAQNKVQGFSIVKGSAVLVAPPLLALFIPARLETWLAVAPTYWPAKVLWVAQAGRSDFGIYLAAGILFQSILVALLVRRFNKVMTR